MNGGGYAGRILRVDLTTGDVRTTPTDAYDLQTFLGGRGVAAKILFEEMAPGVDPLGPDNRLIFFTGPLTGTRIPFSAKHVVVTKSPLTGGYTRSISGGYFSPELKFAGYDGLVVTGKADTHVYLFIDDEKVELRDARALWGLSIPKTEDRIRGELGGPPVRIACIGPAGENLIQFASIVNDTYRFAGRGGNGAVMGAKNLKAVAVRGRHHVQAADPNLLERTQVRAYESIVAHPGFVSRLRSGAMETVPIVYRYGFGSVKYFSGEKFDLTALNPHAMTDGFVVEEGSCFACPHRCLKHTAIKEGPWAGAFAEGPKYETICMFGPNCGNTDLSAIVKANEICASNGMDSASAGNLVAFTMACAEKGIITPHDTGGVPVAFGDGAAVVHLLESIVRREGIGDLLAEGVQRAAAKLGPEAQELAMHIKGQEMASFDPRGYPAMGLAYATSNRGADHMGPPFRLDQWWAERKPDSPDRLATKGKADVVVRVQNWYALLDSMMFCSFSRYGLTPELYQAFFEAVTGQRMSWDQANALANGIYSLERRFNLREGFTAADDLLPRKFVDGPDGVPIQDMVAEYYAVRGWDSRGVPLT